MIKKNARWGDIFSAVCVILLVYLSAAALEETAWVSGLTHVTHLAILGVLIGLAIGQSQFDGKISIWLMTCYSIVLIPWEIIFSGGGNAEWLDKAFDFFMRVGKTLSQLMNNQPLQDGILFYLGMGVLFWFIGLLSGYYLNRYAKPWIPLSIAGLAIITIQLFQVYDLRNNLLSAVFAFILIILIVRLNYWVSHLTWMNQQVSEDVDTAAIFAKVGLILAVVLVIVAWSTPFVINVFTPGTEEQITFGERFKGLSVIAENFFAPFRQLTGNQEGYFGHTLTLGNERSLSEKIIFRVSPPSSDFYNGRYYWRARVFDQYLNGYWQETSFEEIIVDADELISDRKKSGLKTGEFTFTANVKLATIFAFPEIESLNHDVRVQVFNVDDEKDLLSVSPIKSINSGDSYTLVSSIRELFREDLLTADGEISLAIQERYLQLPTGYSPRVKRLAEEITLGLNTNYEKVVAITTYLRQNYQYVDRLEDTPERNDPIEWFLFEYKKGFCNYFASSDVLLLRALGIPARLAAGYSQGLRAQLIESFEVREKDSHAWVEVYFSGIGWVAFEPTPSQPVLIYGRRSYVSSSDSDNDFLNRNESGDSEGFGLPLNSEREDMKVLVQDGEGLTTHYEYLTWMLGFIILLIAFFIYFKRKVLKKSSLPVLIESGFNQRGMESPQWVTEWARHQKYTAFEKQFVHIDRMLKILNEKVTPADTPKQKINRLITRIPEINEKANIVLHEYEEETYGRNPGNYETIRLLIKKLWKSTVKQLILEKLEPVRKILIRK